MVCTNMAPISPAAMYFWIKAWQGIPLFASRHMLSHITFWINAWQAIAPSRSGMARHILFGSTHGKARTGIALLDHGLARQITLGSRHGKE